MPRTTPHESPIAVYAAIGGNLAIAIAKFAAAALTGSSAMISEAIHSTVDTGNQLLLLLGIRRSDRPADQMHPFGHGKELYFWSLVVAIVLFGAGGGMSIYEGITHILQPAPIEDPRLNYVILAIAAVVEGTSFTIAAREIGKDIHDESVWHAIRNSKDPSVVTVLFEDGAALAGLSAAFVGIYLADLTGDARLDGWASIVIGLILGAVALFLAYESRGLLIGERADVDRIDRLRQIAEADEAVDRVIRIRTMHMGPDRVVATIRLVIRPARVEQVVDILDRIATRLDEADEGLLDVTIQPVAGGEGELEPDRS
jgi:cation diffusion facilitator family transporter